MCEIAYHELSFAPKISFQAMVNSASFKFLDALEKWGQNVVHQECHKIKSLDYLQDALIFVLPRRL